MLGGKSVHMSTLFVDIDGTLVTWLGRYDRFGQEEWEVNKKVVDYAEKWAATGKAIVLWSSGGESYANMWGNRLLPHLVWIPSAKFPSIPRSGDVCLDDSPFDEWEKLTIYPKELK